MLIGYGDNMKKVMLILISIFSLIGNTPIFADQMFEPIPMPRVDNAPNASQMIAQAFRERRERRLEQQRHEQEMALLRQEQEMRQVEIMIKREELKRLQQANRHNRKKVARESS